MARMSRDADYPEVNDILVGRVREITDYGAMLEVPGYAGRGFLHISELPGRNIRTVGEKLKVGQTIAVKVISVSKSRDQYNVSLKRVGEDEAKVKLREWKESERAREIVAEAAKRLGADPGLFLSEVEAKAERRYGTLSEALRRAIEGDETVLTKIGIQKEGADAICEVARAKIRRKNAVASGVVEATILAPDGAEKLREIFLKEISSAARRQAEVTITTAGSPRYIVQVRAKTAKAAQAALEKVVQSIIAAVNKSGGTATSKGR
ncbi:MAG: S1 RNA-binding domain-containing protein [Candidatus Brockarchaeota archaeon]|nr:S1 RNA-binding domain-containing protein [Candidatus Brockarchaeota archaeon]